MAENVKHIAGPWEFRLEAYRTVIFHKPGVGEAAIAVGAGCYPNHIANARLIAASPDLLEALQVALKEIDAWRNGTNTRSGFANLNDAKVGCCYGGEPYARAAIAKATGETN